MVKIIPTKHFLERCEERKLELTLIPQILNEIKNKPNIRTFEVTNGVMSIIAQYDKESSTCILVTGWAGNRSKKEYKEW